MFTLDQRFGGSVVAQILLHRQDGIGLTEVGDGAVLCKLHKTVARAAGAVAGRAEARKVVILEEPADDLVKRAAVIRFKLSGIFNVANVGNGVAAYGCTRTARNLRNTEFKRFRTDAGAFARRHDHAGIGNGESNQRHNLEEDRVGHGIAEGVRVNIVGRADARHGDGVRPHAPDGFKMLGMHQKADKIVLVERQTKKNAEADVINAAFHSAVMRFCMPSVIRLRSLWMQLLVLLRMVGFLEELIGADLRIMKLAVIFNRRRGDVDVQAADLSVLVFDRIDGLNRLQNVFDGVVLWVLAGLEQQTLVTEVLKSNHFAGDFFLRELLADDVLIFSVIRAIGAGIHAVIGEIERREENDAVAVDFFLDFTGD